MHEQYILGKTIASLYTNVRVAEQRDVGVLVVRRDRRRLGDHQDVGAVIVVLLFPFVLRPFWDERPNLLPEVDQNYLLKKQSVMNH